MATNPMQRKTRNAFLLGMIITLLIAAVVVGLLYMKIKNQNDEIKKYKLDAAIVYVLNQDVESGQVLTADMFTMKSVPRITIPTDAEGIANQSVGEVFNRYLKSKAIPNEMTISRLFCLNKKADEVGNVGNLRPIAISSTFIKMIESAIYTRLLDEINEKKINM